MPASATTQALMQANRDLTATQRVDESMPLSEILTRLAEAGIKVWHMNCQQGRVMLFLGSDAPAIMAEIYDFLYPMSE